MCHFCIVTSYSEVIIVIIGHIVIIVNIVV